MPSWGRLSLPVSTRPNSAGRHPQWRARPVGSRRLARTLGFEEIGAHMSLLVETD
jgi:hypothetical protein